MEPSTGNMRGEENEWNVINTEPLPKRQKSKDVCRKIVECRHLAIICIVKFTFLVTFYGF